MRQPHIIIIGLSLYLTGSLPAVAMTFQTRMEKVEWKVEGDQFECRLSQPIANFGVGEFVRRAGEQATFRLQAHERSMGRGAPVLLAAAAPWQPGRGDINLGALRGGEGNTPFSSNYEQAGRLLSGLMDGRSPLVRHRAWPGGESLEVRLLPVRFNQAYNDYLKCTSGLLPVNFDQVRQVQIGFPGGGAEVGSLAMAKLDVVLDFLKADPSINRFQLDGHSDNSGNRLTNRDLSRRRALAVQDYLVAHGVLAEQIILRFHGERYPLVKNSSEANRARNRRVTLTLSREPILPAVHEMAPAEQAPAAEIVAPATS